MTKFNPKILLRSLKYISYVLYLILLFIPITSRAASTTEGFKAAATLPKGAVVSLTRTGSLEVEKTNINNDSLVVGVIVNATDSLLDVLPIGSQVQVASNGEVNILVSTVNGDIKAGQKLIASPLSGIAAADSPPSPGVRYIAVAETDFNDQSIGIKKAQVTQSDGKSKTVAIGSINAKMLLGNRTPGVKSANTITSLGKQISGKSVSLLQVIVSSVIFITTLILCVFVLQSSIRGTFIALGRNPLSKDSLMNSLIKVFVLVILVFSGGVSIAYAILLF